MSGLGVRLAGLLRSAHALIFALAILAVVLFVEARDAYPIVAYGSFGLFAVSCLAVIGRFVVKGPEADRGQPMVSVSQNQFAIVNFDPESAEKLARFAIRHRLPLPPPAGIIQGKSSDPRAISPISPDLALEIQEADNSDRASVMQDQESFAARLQPPRSEDDDLAPEMGGRNA